MGGIWLRQAEKGQGRTPSSALEARGQRGGGLPTQRTLGRFSLRPQKSHIEGDLLSVSTGTDPSLRERDWPHCFPSRLSQSSPGHWELLAVREEAESPVG